MAVSTTTIINKLQSSELYYANLLHNNLATYRLGLETSNEPLITSLYHILKALRYRVLRNVYDDATTSLYNQLCRHVPFNPGGNTVGDANYKPDINNVYLQNVTIATVNESNLVHLSYDEHITGVKSFSKSPQVPDGQSALDAVNFEQLQQVANQIYALPQPTNYQAGNGLTLDSNYHFNLGGSLTKPTTLNTVGSNSLTINSSVGSRSSSLQIFQGLFSMASDASTGLATIFAQSPSGLGFGSQANTGYGMSMDNTSLNISNSANAGVLPVGIAFGTATGGINGILVTEAEHSTGMIYAGDYESHFVNRSLVTKQFVLSQLTNVQSKLSYTPANDASVVHLSGSESITGYKQFGSAGLGVLPGAGITMVGNATISYQNGTATTTGVVRSNQSSNGIDIGNTNFSKFITIDPVNQIISRNLDAKHVLFQGDVVTDLGFTPENSANKNTTNGYAGLDGTGHIPLSLFPDKVLGNVKYKGTYNGSTVTSADPNYNGLALPVSIDSIQGIYFISTAAFTYNSINYGVGDWIISDGTAGGWNLVKNSDAVSTVFGRNGNVVANAADYSAYYPQMTGSYANPSWITSLPYTKITGTPTNVSSFTNDAGYLTSASNLAWSKITGTPSTIAGYGITDNLVRSISITTNGILYSSPVNFTVTSGAATASLSLANQNANLVFAGPVSGSAGTPTFRSLVASDVSFLSGIYQPLENQRLSTTNGPTFAGLTLSSGLVINDLEPSHWAVTLNGTSSGLNIQTTGGTSLDVNGYIKFEGSGNFDVFKNQIINSGYSLLVNKADNTDYTTLGYSLLDFTHATPGNNIGYTGYMAYNTIGTAYHSFRVAGVNILSIGNGNNSFIQANGDINVIGGYGLYIRNAGNTATMASITTSGAGTFASLTSAKTPSLSTDVVRLSDLSAYATTSSVSAAYQPLENQRLSTTNNVTFNKLNTGQVVFQINSTTQAVAQIVNNNSAGAGIFLQAGNSSVYALQVQSGDGVTSAATIYGDGHGVFNGSLTSAGITSTTDVNLNSTSGVALTLNSTGTYGSNIAIKNVTANSRKELQIQYQGGTYFYDTANSVFTLSLTNTSALFSGAITSAGLTTSGLKINGSAVGAVAGTIYSNASFGMVIYPNAGTTYDFLLTNNVGATVMSIAPGTTTATFAGSVNIRDVNNIYSLTASGNGGTGFVAIGNNSGTPAIQAYTSGFAASTNLSLQPSGGRLLIGKLTDDGTNLLQVNGASAFSGTIYASAPTGYASTNQGTNFVDIALQNTGGVLNIGKETSVAGAAFPGSSAYANVFYSNTNLPYQFIIAGSGKILDINSSGVNISGTLGVSTSITTAGSIVSGNNVNGGTIIQMYTSNNTGGYGIIQSTGSVGNNYGPLSINPSGGTTSFVGIGYTADPQGSNYNKFGVQGNSYFGGILTGNKFVTSGGTSSQLVAGDGTLVTITAVGANQGKISFVSQPSITINNYATQYASIYGQNPILKVYTQQSNGTYQADYTTPEIITYLNNDPTQAIVSITWAFPVATTGFIQIYGKP